MASKPKCWPANPAHPPASLACWGAGCLRQNVRRKGTQLWIHTVNLGNKEGDSMENHLCLKNEPNYGLTPFFGA